MIEVEGLTRYYGDFAAVQDATFSIGEREIVGFLGLNGAGKSTILKVLAGLLMPSAGTVRVGGIDALEDPDALRTKIGFLPEDPPLYREMQVREFLRWVGQVKGCSTQDVDAELPKVIELCDLGSMQHKVIGELSHGYRKRVGIAQAIIHRPEVVILDEPISGLDPQQIVEMREVVRSLKERATVLISSHILTEVAVTCDRVLVIHGGRIVAAGSTDELAEQQGGGGSVTLSLRGTVVAVKEALSSSDAVTDFDVGEDEGLVRVDVTLAEGERVRDALVGDMVAAGLGVFAVQDTVSELEQAFLQLTRGGAKAAPAQEKEAS
ncbi:MAG: ABC transporter ATP-binding protein [Nannocystaceae bacterium]|nr:ABC transporter ATP-binding protein [Nannocystaceae bacterium]